MTVKEKMGERAKQLCEVVNHVGSRLHNIEDWTPDYWNELWDEFYNELRAIKKETYQECEEIARGFDFEAGIEGQDYMHPPLIVQEIADAIAQKRKELE